MSIFLVETSKQRTEVRRTEFNRGLTSISESYSTEIGIWQSAVDILMSFYVENNLNSTNYIQENMTLYIDSLPDVDESGVIGLFIKVCEKMKKLKIEIKPKGEQKNMDNREFHIKCAEFGEDQQHNHYDGNSPAREYAHPMDSVIINFLDNPAINAVFKELVNASASVSWGGVLASGVPVNENTYPQIDKLIKECCHTLHIKQPYVVVSSSAPGLLNAMTMGSDEEPYIVLSPLLVKTMNENRLKYIIGHECGHIAMGHVTYHTVLNIAKNFAAEVPLVGPILQKYGTLPMQAWSRRSEISADRAGLLCCGNAEDAKRALLQLEMPFMDIEIFDINEYIENSNKFLGNGVLRKIGEYEHSHPLIPKRIEAIDLFSNSNKYQRLIGNFAFVGGISDEMLNSRTEEIIKVI